MAGTYPHSQVPRARSARQQFWLDHLRAWHAQDTSLRAYAAANGLSSSSLYRARRRLERRGVAWPRHGDVVVSLTGAQLNFLLDGYDLWRASPHRQVRYASMY